MSVKFITENGERFLLEETKLSKAEMKQLLSEYEFQKYIVFDVTEEELLDLPLPVVSLAQLKMKLSLSYLDHPLFSLYKEGEEEKVKVVMNIVTTEEGKLLVYGFDHEWKTTYCLTSRISEVIGKEEFPEEPKEIFDFIPVTNDMLVIRRLFGSFNI